MIRITSVSELRARLSEIMDALNAENAVMVVRYSKPAAYLISPAMFERLLERIEDLEDQTDMVAALADYRAGQAVGVEDLFVRVGL